MAKKNLKQAKHPKPRSSSKKKQSRSKKIKNKDFVVVGIGASAGGLEALSELFKNIPSDTGMAFTIVQHMDPKHESMLKSIISRLTDMHVLEVKSRMPLEANHIYVIPPNKNMTIKKNRFYLVPRSKKLGIHLPINCFFASLAKEKGTQAVGIILSGSASDGSLGLNEIKAQGGITFCQDVGSAKFSGMPASAIQLGGVDYVLSPKRIAKELVKFSKHMPLKKVKIKSFQESFSKVKGDMAKIFFLLNHFTGVDFNYYKKTTVERRIKKRMATTRKTTIKDYIKTLRENPSEVEALFSDLLINVTSFFRDMQAYKALKQKVLPILLKHKRIEKQLRIWVPACSTGEEVYSLAICILESLGPKADAFKFQLFGTDVNETVVNKARRGLYPSGIKTQMSSALLRRYFTKEESGYRIIKAVRDMCIFAKQDLTRDPPFSKLDLVSCRNMLIYMEPPLQKKVIPLLNYSLNPYGFLMLGTAETIGPYKDLFNVIDKKHKIYQKKLSSERNLMHLSLSSGGLSTSLEDKRPARSNLEEQTVLDLEDESLQAKDEELKSAFEEIQSANEELQSTNEELETSKEELQSTNEELTTLNDELANRNVELTQLSSDIQNLFNSARIPVIMINRDLRIRRFTPLAKSVWNLIDADIGRTITDINPNITISNLKGMLLDSIDHLKTSRAEVTDSKGCWYDLAVFPYKTVENVIDGAVITLKDISLLKKAGEVLEVKRKYFENIVEAVSIPMLVLDKNLLIRSANASFYRDYKSSKKQTEGRFIYELGNQDWNIPSLIEHLRKVISRKQSFDRFKVCNIFEHIGERTMLLTGRIFSESISGERLMLMLVVDITEQEQLEVAKNNLIRDIAHGVKTPISMAEMAINLVEKGIEQRDFEKIKQSNHIAQNNIRKVRKDFKLILESFSMDLKRLDISKKKKKKKKKSASLKTVLNQAIKTNQLLINDKSLKIHLRVLPRTDKVSMDKKDLKLLFDNIIDNAVKFTEKGSITISSRLKKDWIEIRIRDTGCGITEKDRPKVFERFYKRHAAIDGTGLGLSICKDIVEMYNGRIFIESKGEGKGTTVVIQLLRK